MKKLLVALMFGALLSVSSLVTLPAPRVEAEQPAAPPITVMAFVDSTGYFPVRFESDLEKAGAQLTLVIKKGEKPRAVFHRDQKEIGRIPLQPDKFAENQKAVLDWLAKADKPPDPPKERKFKTGAKPTPAHKILAAPRYRVPATPPAQIAYVPSKLDMWGNDQYGDCVTAEEGFAKACYSPEIFIDPKLLIDWARAGGYLEGANLTDVMDSMQKGGFLVGQQRYNDGPYASVDYSNETVLRSAIAQGPVKIGIASAALPSGAGNQSGWYSFGSNRGGSQDHCTTLCGYGTAAECFKALGVPVPQGVDPAKADCYLQYTWSTIGVVDHLWIMSALGEAWIRSPTTVGVPPLPPPVGSVTVTMADVASQAGVAATFMPIATGGTAPYTWTYDYGDGAKGTTNTHVYAAVGSYIVTATATDSKAASGTGSCRATVTGGPPTPVGPYPIVTIGTPGDFMFVPVPQTDADRMQLIRYILGVPLGAKKP